MKLISNLGTDNFLETPNSNVVIFNLLLRALLASSSS